VIISANPPAQKVAGDSRTDNREGKDQLIRVAERFGAVPHERRKD
jgi:hypothetical protein